MLDIEMPGSRRGPRDCYDIILQYLENHGYDGLCNLDGQCGCSRLDLSPAYCLEANCEPAYEHADPRPGHEGEVAYWTSRECPSAEDWEYLE